MLALLDHRFMKTQGHDDHEDPQSQNDHDQGNDDRENSSDTSSSCCSDFEYMSNNEVIIANERDVKKLKAYMKHIIRY